MTVPQVNPARHQRAPRPEHGPGWTRAAARLPCPPSPAAGPVPAAFNPPASPSPFSSQTKKQLSASRFFSYLVIPQVISVNSGKQPHLALFSTDELFFAWHMDGPRKPAGFGKAVGRAYDRGKPTAAPPQQGQSRGGGCTCLPRQPLFAAALRTQLGKALGTTTHGVNTGYCR